MSGRQSSDLLCQARLAFDGDAERRRKALKYLRKKAVRAPAEAAGILELLSSVQPPISTERDVGVRALLNMLWGASDRATASVITDRAPGVLSQIAPHLPVGTGSWVLALHILACIRTRESIACWAECFLAHRAGWGCTNDYEMAAAMLCLGKVPHGDVLFPRILEGLSDQAKRSTIVGIVNAAVNDRVLGKDPLAEHIDVLADMLNPAYRAQAAPGEWEEGADLACAALRQAGTPEAIDALARALNNPLAAVRLKAAHALAQHSDPRGVDALVAACRSPFTLARAAALLEKLGLADRMPPEAADPDLRAPALVARELAFALDRGDPSPDAVSVVARRDLPWPPEGTTEVARVVRYRLPPTDLGESPTGHAVVAAGTLFLPRLRSDQEDMDDFFAYGLSGAATEKACVPDLGQGAVPEDALAVAYFAALRLQGLIVERKPTKGDARAAAQRSAWHAKPRTPETDPGPWVLLALHMGRHLLSLAGQRGGPGAENPGAPANRT